MADEKAPDSEPTQPIIVERPSTRTLETADVKDVLNLTLAKMREENNKTLAALQESTERLQTVSERASEVAKSLSVPPPEPDEK